MMKIDKLICLILISCFVFAVVSPGICQANSATASQREKPRFFGENNNSVSFPKLQENDIDLIKNLKLIEERMSDVNTLKTKFIQEKYLSLFKQKLEIRGSLYVKKPSSFAWHIDSPLKQRIILDKNIVKQWDEDTNQVQRINLEKNPSFSVVTDQMKRWVSGSYLSLIDEYQIEIIQLSPMELKFIPLENAIAYNMIESVTILFQVGGKCIDTINISEINGDLTKFKFVETFLNIKLDNQVWKVKVSD